MIKKKIFMKKACRMLDCFILKYIVVLHVEIFIPKHVYPFFENFDSKKLSCYRRGCGHRSFILELPEVDLCRDLKHNLQACSPTRCSGNSMMEDRMEDQTEDQ